MVAIHALSNPVISRNFLPSYSTLRPFHLAAWTARCRATWRSRTTVCSSRAPSPMTWLERTSATPPTESAHALASWTSTSPVGQRPSALPRSFRFLWHGFITDNAKKLLTKLWAVPQCYVLLTASSCVSGIMSAYFCDWLVSKWLLRADKTEVEKRLVASIVWTNALYVTERRGLMSVWVRSESWFFCFRQDLFKVTSGGEDVCETCANSFNGCKQLFLSHGDLEHVKNVVATRKTATVKTVGEHVSQEYVAKC